jgi:hypothetical protein
MKVSFNRLTTIVGLVLLMTLIIPPSVFPGKHPISAWADDDDHSPHCTTTVSAENVGNNAIQTAINSANNGDVICIAGGTYPEQLSITKPLTLEGLGTASHPTEIQPTTLVQNSGDFDNIICTEHDINNNCIATAPTPEYNIILVGSDSSIAGVTISNLLVDGSLASSTFNSCADDYEGIEFSNASGIITGTTVQNIYLPLVDAGCQPGLDINVQTASGDSSSVTISNNQALNYNKNGITCNDVGTTCTITKNTVSFYAPYEQYIASNGIQIGFGAVGTVSHNTVSGNECTLASVCGPNYVTQTQSTGILTYESGAGTVVSDNTASDNDVGILDAADTVKLTNNVLQNNGDEGMYLNDGTYTASNNHISSSLIGIAIVSDGYVANPTTAALNGNNLIGTFSTAPVQVVAFTGAPNGGTYSEPATLTLHKFSETVTAGSSATPSFVNITNLP